MILASSWGSHSSFHEHHATSSCQLVGRPLPSSSVKMRKVSGVKPPRDDIGTRCGDYESIFRFALSKRVRAAGQHDLRLAAPRS